MKRFWEVDALRGIAIIGMVIYHLIYDLEFYGFNVSVNGLGVFQKIVAGIFILLVGISLTLSYSKGRSFNYYLHRGGMIFAWGMGITLVTYLFLGESYVRFGVLHLIGVSIVMAYPSIKKKWFNFGLGVGLIGLYFIVRQFSSASLYVLGFTPNFSTVDYFPILPWFGVVLLGVFVGNSLYKGGRQFTLPKWKFPWLQWLGRKSLIIYLVHQPILLVLIQGWLWLG